MIVITDEADRQDSAEDEELSDTWCQAVSIATVVAAMMALMMKTCASVKRASGPLNSMPPQVLEPYYITSHYCLDCQ